MPNKQYPSKIFLSLLLFVFVVELSIMLLFKFSEDSSEISWRESLVDAVMLTSFCAPFFWYFAIKPLQRTLEALSLEGFKLHKILEMAGEGIVSIDATGKIQSFNRAAQNIFGYSEAEVINQNVTVLIPHPHRDSHDEYLTRYLQTGQANVLGKTMEFQGLRKEGTIFPMELTLTEVKLGDTHMFTAVLRDVSEQKLAQQRIEHLAHYDTLTNLPNRSLFLDRLQQSIIVAKRNKQGIALLFLDLDGFKQVNDTFGHHFGDLLLIKVAERLNLSVRESDTLARLGGDEFTFILNDAHGRQDVAVVADKVIESINVPFDLKGHAVHIGISIGIARYPKDADTAAMLIVVADRAMYAAKHAGKNTYRFGIPVGEETKSFPVLDANK